MSRRGKNNVKRAIVREATSSLFGDAVTTQPKIATNNYNPLFHYLQTMFPNYENAVLHSVLEQEGNSIERAIEVLLTFAEEPKTKEPESVDNNNIDFFDDFSDTDLPPNVFALPVPPSQNSGRDHVSLYEHQKQRKNKKSQRARRRQALQKQQQQLLQEHKKRVKWVPLEDYVIEQRNPFGVLDELPPLDDAVEEKNLPLDDRADEAQTLLTQEEIEESWKQFEEAAVAQEEIHISTQSASSDFGEEWSDYAPPADEFSSLSADETSGVDEFVVIDEEQQQEPLVDSAVFESADEFGSREQQVVVKLYYSPSDIHRLGLKRSALTFSKLYDHAEAYLSGKCQQVAKSALPRAFALTYVDDEADTIHLCSEEELVEALRLHEDVFWVDGKQPVLRLHIKALEVAVHGGHLIVGA